MKKTLSLLLAFLMIVPALSACSIHDVPSISTNITVASSDAESYAEWLTERLDSTVPDSVVLGIGNDNAYGVDMSSFEDDGYIIKTVGEDILLIGKTADGLDRAVRKYANATDRGETVEETVYHEGYRVEQFTLFGRDISEYTVVMPESYNANMELAANDLVKLIKQACGAALTLVIGETDASPVIRLEHSDKEELKIGGFEYYEENGDLVFSGALREGCTNAVYRFLETECDWNWLIYGDSDLQETDHLVIESGLYKKEIPAFEWHIVSRNLSNTPFKTDRTVHENAYLSISAAQQSYPTKHANHGMTKYNWANWVVNIHTGQICYTTESFYYTVVENVLKYLKEQEDNGAIIGETIRDVDISQGDSGRYCECERCMEAVAEDEAIIGPVVKFANDVAEAVNAEYPGADILFKLFAYFHAFKPPVVNTPNKWVSVSYAPNGSCANHYVDGSECDPDTITDFGVTGVEFGQYLDDWCAISDNIYVWYYHIGENFNYYNVWDLIHYDYQHMHEIGVKGLYFYNYARGMGLKRVEHMLAWQLQWDIDMTWEEYEALFHTILEYEYGEGWESLLDVLNMYEEMDTDKCWSCWGYGDKTDAIERYDMSYLLKNGETMIELMEEAIRFAGSAKQEELAEMFSISLYYCNCYANFFKALNENDTEKLAELEADYQLILDRIAKHDYDYQKLPTILHLSMKDNIWDEAYEEWAVNRNKLPSGNEPDAEYTSVTLLNRGISALGEVTDYDTACDVVRLYEEYSKLSDEDKAMIEDIDKLKAALDSTASFFDYDAYGLKVMSFNVYYKDLTPERISRVANRILEESPDVIGIQEGMPEMCEGILALIGDKYEMLGIGREATEDSENCNVFYNKEKFDLIDSNTFWLTRTPDKCSTLDGAWASRICTYQLLQRKSDGQMFIHANTHFDLASDAIRKGEALFLTEYLFEEYGKLYPMVITGDFNCNEGTPGYNKIIEEGFKVTNTYGENVPTYQGWGEKSNIIDFIFASEFMPVKSYKVCDAQMNDDYVSDHNAIVSELILLPTYESLTTVVE